VIWATSKVLSPVLSIEERGRYLFRAAEQLDLEGIVAKRKADAYGPATVWYKVKNRAYTQMEGRWQLFERSR
jgi:ATP-dependent DNA ligase